MGARIIIVAATIDANLGGIARSVPTLARAVGTCGQRQPSRVPDVLLLAPRAEPDTLEEREQVYFGVGLNVQLCDGFAGVKQKLEELTSDPTAVSFIYHAGVWNSLNHFVARLGRRKNIPVIVSTRSMLDPWALNHRKWKKRLAWWAYARRDLLSATAIHATAELEAGYIRKALGEKCPSSAKATEGRPPVFVVPNGVELPGKGLTRSHGEHKGNLTIGTSLRDPSGSVREKLRRILFLSRIHEKKGVLDLVNAFGELNPEGWELVIAGNDDGNHQTTCEQLAQKQPNADRISFPGAISDADKWDLYRSADVFVLPSYSENFGIVVGEALGMGVPVITTNETPWHEFSHTEARRHGATGKDLGLWVVETGVEAIKGAMREAMGLSDEERRAMGERGAEWIRREFSWEAIGRQFLEEVEKVLGRAKVR